MDVLDHLLAILAAALAFVLGCLYCWPRTLRQVTITLIVVHVAVLGTYLAGLLPAEVDRAVSFLGGGTFVLSCLARILLDRVERTLIGEQAEALEGLPDLSRPAAQAARATSTDGKPAPKTWREASDFRKLWEALMDYPRRQR